MVSIGRFLVVCGAVLAVGAAVANPGRNAFLDWSVSSTNQLVGQAKKESRIMDAYKRHFAMTEPQVLAYLSSLKAVRLKEDTAFLVYSIPKSGELKSHVEILKKGELVFVDGNGTPMIRAKCGNPLGRGPSGPEAVPLDADVNVPTSEVVEMPTPDSMEFVPVAMVAMEPEIPVVPELVVTPEPTITTTISKSSIPPLWLLGLPFIGGNDSGGDTPVVPEPGTMIALGLGAAAFAARKRKK
jgi:hypothetical protein